MSFPRYPAYKNSGVEWLEEVPAHWEVVRLNTIATCNDEVLLESTPEDYEIEYVEISGVQAGQGIVETEALPFGNAPSRARRVVRDGDVLISTVRTYLRAIAQVKNPPENMIASTGFAVLRPRRVISGFLGHACHAKGFVSEVIARSVGVSYPAINASELARLPLPLPPAPEQTAIATFLDRETAKIDALVAEQEKLIALLKEKRQAVISQAVTKGLDPTVPMKDSGVEWLGEVPAHWAVERIKRSTLSVKNGIWGDDAQDNENDIPCVRVADFDRQGLRVQLTEPTIRNVIASERVGRILNKGDLLLEKSGGGEGQPVGCVVLYDDSRSAVCSNFVARVQTAPDMDSSFWRYVHAAAYFIRLNTKSIKQTSGIQNLDASQYFDERAGFPPLFEQNQIAAYLDRETLKFDNLTTEAQRAVTLLQERRAALISAAVTGQIDVRGSETVQA